MTVTSAERSYDATTNPNSDPGTQRYGVRELRPLHADSVKGEAKSKSQAKGGSGETAEKEQGQGLAFSLSAPLAFRSLSLLTLSGEAIPRQAASRNLRADDSEALRVSEFAPVVAEGLFIQVS